MSEVIQRNAEEVQGIAEKMGLVCFIPEDGCELQLDLDRKDIADLNPRIQEVMEQNGFKITAELRTISKSGGCHMYLRLNSSVGPLQRICLQALLGSDPVRELLSMIRLDQGSTAPTALFETKAQAVKVKAFRYDHEDDRAEMRPHYAVPKTENILTDDDIPW